MRLPHGGFKERAGNDLGALGGYADTQQIDSVAGPIGAMLCLDGPA